MSIDYTTKSPETTRRHGEWFALTIDTTALAHLVVSAVQYIAVEEERRRHRRLRREQRLAGGTIRLVRHTFHVEEALLEAMRREAALARTSIAEVVNRAFRDYLARRDTEGTP